MESTMPSSSSSANGKHVFVVKSIMVATVVLMCGLVHFSALPDHIHARAAHHRMLRQLQATSSLRMIFHAKRDSMQIHGHSDFEVLVQPTFPTLDSDSFFEFNGIATFVDGGSSHTYKLVDGVTYYINANSEDEATRVSLVPAGEMPPVHLVLEAIASATLLDSVQTTQTIDCPASSQLYHARFTGQDFVLCSFESTDAVGLRVFGEDFNVEILTSTAQLSITKPQLTTGQQSLSTTDVVPRSTLQFPPSSILRIFQRAGSDSLTRLLAQRAERRLELQATTCGCATKPRPCIFFHGMDIKEDRGLVDDFDFFGGIKNHAPCCSSIKFAVMNTVDYAWNNATLVDKACAYALSMSPTSDKTTNTIEDTIVVAHSMGNLMLAHAESSGKCQMGKTSSWVALSGPFKGSMGSDFQQQICTGDYFAKEVVAAVVALFGQCPQSKARQGLVYEGGNFATAELNAQYEAAKKVHERRVTAGVCGFSANGLTSGDWLGLALGGSILPHKSKENDGVVEFQSCIGNVPATSFGENWANRFYRAKLNHADTTLKHGDAWFDNTQKPVKWFECLAL